jgi:hypothetical protein
MIAAVAGLLTGGCDCGGGKQVGEDAGIAGADAGTRVVTSVTVAPASSCLFLADTVQLAAEARDAVGVVAGQPVTWASSDPAVAAVDANGLVTASKRGVVGITAKVGDVQSAPAAVAVNPKPSGVLSYSARDPASGRYRVRTVNLDGTGDASLADGFQPRMSPDGKRMAFLRGGSADTGQIASLVDLDLTGTRTPAEMTLYANTTDFIHSFGWSGDSSQVVYDWQNGIFRVADAGGAPTTISQVSPNDDCPDVNPVDGRVAFHNYVLAMFAMDSAGAGRTAIPNTGPGDYLPRWSPDGVWLSYFHADATSHQPAPHKIRPDGTGLTRLVGFALDANNHALGTSFPWTPDGAWVVALLVRGDAAAQTTGIWAVASDGSGCMIPVPVAAAQASSADYLGSVK